MTTHEVIDLKDAIGNYEFWTSNHISITPDGSLHQCSEKSKLTHALESLGDSLNTNEDRQNQGTSRKTCVILDGIAVIQAMVVHKEHIKSCKNLSNIVIQAIDYKTKGYDTAYITFGDYNIERYCTVTKDCLTLFLADKLVKCTKSKMVTFTRARVLDNLGILADIVKTSSEHEEADTKMILYAAEIYKRGYNVDIYSLHTDLLVLAISVFPHLSPQTIIIMGTG